MPGRGRPARQACRRVGPGRGGIHSPASALAWQAMRASCHGRRRRARRAAAVDGAGSTPPRAPSLSIRRGDAVQRGPGGEHDAGDGRSARAASIQPGTRPRPSMFSTSTSGDAVRRPRSSVRAAPITQPALAMRRPVAAEAAQPSSSEADHAAVRRRRGGMRGCRTSGRLQQVRRRAGWGAVRCGVNIEGAPSSLDARWRPRSCRRAR